MIQLIRFTIFILLLVANQGIFAQSDSFIPVKQDSSKRKYFSDSLRTSAKKYPVYGLFKDTLFYICARTGRISPAMRAEIISSRIKKLSEVYLPGDSLQLVDSYNSTDIMFNDIIVVSVTDEDAFYENSDRQQLANIYKVSIEKEVVKFRNEVSFFKLAKEAGAAVLVLICVCLLIFYIIKFFRWLSIIILQSEHKLLKGFKINSYTLLDSKRQIRLILLVTDFVKWSVILITVYITVPVLFGFFPWTKNYGSILFGYILNPVKAIALGFWNYFPNLITILVILIIFHYVNKVIRFLKKEVEAGVLKIPGFYPDWANPTYQIVRVLLFAFLLVVIFPYLPGSDSPVFQGVSVFLGFLFTFGSAGSLSNIIAGIVLTYMRLFKIGDRVKIGEVTGDVIEKSLLVTRIRTIKNEIISIPNSSIMNNHTINYSSDAASTGLIVHTTVTIGYDVPWKDMHQALIDAAVATPYILQEPKPFVLQTGLEDFYVAYQINAYTKEPNKQALIYSELHQNIQNVCNERGIEIMSPHYRAGRDGNHTTIPAEYLPKDYKAPGFTVRMDTDSSNADGK